MSGSIIHLSVVDSTNIYTTKLLSQSDIKEWTTVVSDSQNAGKGQRGKTWDSEFGKNLLCSTLIKPTHLRIQEQFLISAAASLAVCNTLMDFGLEPQIKWPNDVLVGKHKIAGLLIENQLAKEHIESSIVGLGLNVNQEGFNHYHWPATSMLRELNGQELDRDEVMMLFRDHFKTLLQVSSESKMQLLSSYNGFLFAKGQKVDFNASDQKLSGKLKGVTLLGEIVIERMGKEERFVNGEIKLVHTSA